MLTKSPLRLWRLFLAVIASVLTTNSIAGDVVEGMTVDRQTGNPLAGVRVSVREHPETFADSGIDGTFRLPELESGVYTIAARIVGDVVGEGVVENVDTNALTEKVTINLATFKGLSVVAKKISEQPSSHLITANDFLHAAGSGGDPMKAIQNLPGVAIGEDLSSSVAIRGARPGAHIYSIDFLPVGYVFHAGGSVSILQPELISEIGFYPSSYGVEHGDNIGAVFEFTTESSPVSEWSRTVDLSLLGANLLARGPVTKTQDIALSFRRSFLDLALKAINYNDNHAVQVDQEPVYYDYFGRYTWRLDNHHRLIWQTVAASDDVATKNPASPFLAVTNEHAEFQTNAIKLMSKYGSTQNQFAFGILNNTNWQTDGDFRDYRTRENIAFVREQVSFDLAPTHRVISGTDIVAKKVNYHLAVCTHASLSCTHTLAMQEDSDRRTYRAAFYLKDRWQISKSTHVTFGGRAAYDNIVRRPLWEPRFSLLWEISRQLKFTAATGLYHRLPEDGEILGRFSNPRLDAIRSEQTLAGIELRPFSGWSAKIETFYNRITGDVDFSNITTQYKNIINGKAYGIELLLKKEIGQYVTGWFSLTGSRALLTNQETGRSYRSYYDQPIIASLLINGKLPSSSFIDLKWYYHSGGPYTPIASVDELTSPNNTVIYIPKYGDRNSARYPSYQRFDMRLSKNYVFANWKTETYIEAINLLDRKNVYRYNYPPDYSYTVPSYQIPRLYAFGVKTTF